MKILFAALMCLVLGGSQCFAISGGPVYPGGLNVVGTFGGVLLPGATTNRCEPDSGPCGQNSLGVFSIGVPDAGLASGAFVMFAEGRVFSGTVRGTADPNNSTLKAVLEATFDFTIVGSNDPIDVTATANGTLETNITNAPRAFSIASTRLQGDATLDISQGRLDPVTLKPVKCCLESTVIGFKQSNTVVTGG